MKTKENKLQNIINHIKTMVYNLSLCVSLKKYCTTTENNLCENEKIGKFEKILKLMAEFIEKTKEEIAKINTYNTFTATGMALAGCVYPAIYAVFVNDKNLLREHCNMFLFFGSISLCIFMSFISMRQKVRDARREDFYDKAEEELKENLKNDIKSILNISDKSNINLEERITDIISDKYEKQINDLKIEIFKKPLKESNSYWYFFLDKIGEQRLFITAISILMFSILMYRTI